MDEKDWIKLSAPLSKIGNSYSVRIPMQVIKELGVEEGNLIVLKVRKLNLNWSTEIMDLWFSTARKCKEFDKFSDDKVVLLSRLAHNEGKSVLESVDQKYKEDIDAGKKMSESLKLYRNKLKEEFGEKIYRDFIYFRSVIDPIFDKMNRST